MFYTLADIDYFHFYFFLYLVRRCIFYISVINYELRILNMKSEKVK